MDKEVDDLISSDREFHSLVAVGINDLLYKFFLDLGTVRSRLFRKSRWLTLWTLGGTRLRRYCGVIFFII